jgi:glycosyltransferase involved in cell wall biosynthesis
MDIAVIIPELQKYGGAERVLLECLRRWQNRHRITLYSTATNYDLLAEAGVRKVQVESLSPPFGGEHAVLLNATLLPKIWEGEIGHHEIYHGHLWPTHLLNVHPMVWYPHEPLRMLYDLLYSLGTEGDGTEVERFLHFYPKQRYDKISEAYYGSVLRTIHDFDLTGQPDRIVANSRYTALALEAIYGRPVTDVVYPGVTVGDFPEPSASEDIVLIVGQLWRHKRVRLVIEAMRYLESMELYVVGSGPERQNLQQEAERLGVADKVIFRTGLSNAELTKLFARCLCTVFVPVREPFGIVALETLAAGKPLVAVSEGGFIEVLDDRCSFLVSAEPKVIADRIQRLRSDRALAKRMGAHGRRIAKRYSWDRTARELLAIVDQCRRDWIGRHPRPRIGKSDRRLVGAHYFTWYREGYGNAHWNDTVTHGAVSDAPAIGYYDSNDGDTLRHHLKLMLEAKLDFICFNLHVNDSGIDGFQLRGAIVMCRLAREMNSTLRFAVNLCVYTHDANEIEQAMSIVRDEFLDREDALKIDGKPTLFMFWTGSFENNQPLIRKLHALSEGCVRIALSASGSEPVREIRKLSSQFDGYSVFQPLMAGAAGDLEALWQEAYDAGAAMGGHCHVLTLSPGYDDTPLQSATRDGARVREIPRDNGATYRRMMDFALRQRVPPDITLISSFNEFHENTHIEPTERYGDTYMRMTADFVSALKRKARGGTKPGRRRARRSSP